MHVDNRAHYIRARTKSLTSEAPLESQLNATRDKGYYGDITYCRVVIPNPLYGKTPTYAVPPVEEGLMQVKQ